MHILRYVLCGRVCCNCKKYVCPIEGVCVYLNKGVKEVLSDEVAFICCSVAKLCTALCDPTDCSTPGSSVPKIAQVHVL